MSQQDIRTRVIEVVKELVDSRQDNPPDIQGVSALISDLGLASLDLAELVAILESEIGFDPFAAKVPITSIKTVDDLCTAYASQEDAPGT